MELKQIYDIQNLKLRFKDKKALEIKTLRFHNGLVYGICGNFGSGKTSLLKILAGELKESEGSVLYQGNEFKKGFFDCSSELSFVSLRIIEKKHRSDARRCLYWNGYR